MKGKPKFYKLLGLAGAQNPFYLPSAGLVLCGLYVSLGSADNKNKWRNTRWPEVMSYKCSMVCPVNPPHQISIQQRLISIRRHVTGVRRFT